jgi:hypothetical protein
MPDTIPAVALPVPLLRSLLEYLSTKPYREVAQVMPMLIALLPPPEPPVG